MAARLSLRFALLFACSCRPAPIAENGRPDATLAPPAPVEPAPIERDDASAPSVPVQDFVTLPPVATGPRTIWDAYEKNEVGADNRFRDKRLQLTGLVRQIKKDAVNTIVVELGATSSDNIACKFGDEWATQVGELERGQLVALECTGRGLVLGTPQLGDCAMKWRQPSDATAFATLLAASYELCVLDKVERFVASGGTSPNVTKALIERYRRIGASDNAALSKLGITRLPCDHPAVAVTGNCDGENLSAPQCSSPLLELTRKHLHYGDLAQGSSPRSRQPDLESGSTR